MHTLPPSPSAPDTPVYVIVGANADSMYERLMRTIGRPDLVGTAYKHNNHRVERQVEIEEAISSWKRSGVQKRYWRLAGDGVPVGRVVSVREIMDGSRSRLGWC